MRSGQGRESQSLHPSDRFREVIEATLSDCAVVFVVMSKQWTQITDFNGIRRLEQPDDVVCWEITNALDDDGLKVVPVLVGGASMPRAEDLPASIRAIVDITALELKDQHWDIDFEELIGLINRTVPKGLSPIIDINPFSIRAAIRDDEFFHNREKERRTLRDYLRGRQNCQLVGALRIGKSSVLRYIERHCIEWCPTARVAYIDLQDPRCYTLTGWLRAVAQGFQLPHIPGTLSELMESIEDLLHAGVHPVLCLDEFGQMAQRSQEFPREVFLTLRASGQRGMSILTAAPKRLSQLTDPRDDSSPFFNTFPVLPIRVFSPADSRSYVELAREGLPAFTPREKERILEFAQDHPLALQTACYHVLAARESGDDIPTALLRAREECGKVLG